MMAPAISWLKETDMTYKEVIMRQRELLPSSQNWWPKYLYHFTDLRNALGIIDKGWIYGRNEAVASKLMGNDNASQSVISVTQTEITNYARLYFRPKTPTQYHNEGYKPVHIRNAEVNASCPVPVFFFLDAESVLETEGVVFSEKSCAGMSAGELKSGSDEFSKLPFDKIYHNAAFSSEERDDIIKHRHAEVLSQRGFELEGCVKGIVCRSLAEKQTLLYQLRTKYPQKYSLYRYIIRCIPESDVFFNNGIYIKSVDYQTDGIILKLNEPCKRVGRDRASGKDLCLSANVYYYNENNSIVDSAHYSTEIDYSACDMVRLKTKEIKTEMALVEIKFDDIVMFENEIDLSCENFV